MLDVRCAIFDHHLLVSIPYYSNHFKVFFSSHTGGNTRFACLFEIGAAQEEVNKYIVAGFFSERVKAAAKARALPEAINQFHGQRRTASRPCPHRKIAQALTLKRSL